MTTKLVKIHRCGFCKKKSFQKPCMEKHELHCTKNPARKCRMCEMAQLVQIPLKELLEKYESYTNAELLKLNLRQETGNCPACYLSYILQAKNSHLLDAWDFKFKEEARAWFEENCKSNAE